MRRFKLICTLQLFILITVMTLAQQPPEALNVHQHDGSITSTLFDDLRNLEFSGETLIVHPISGTSTSIRMDDVSNITFGDYIAGFPVTFSVVGSPLGYLTATLDNHPIESGTKVEEGAVIVFTAVPNEGCEVKEWVINGEVQSSEIYFSLEVHEALEVTVEFSLLNSLTESVLRKGLNVYSCMDNIMVESAWNIKSVSLMDVCGKTLYRYDADNTVCQLIIPTRHLTAGVYLVNVLTTQGNISRKIMIQ